MIQLAHAGNDVMAAWHAEHLDFLRRLDFLEAQVAVLHTGERPDYERMLETLQYLRDFPDEWHHRCEDAVLAHLAPKYPGMELAFVRLHQEHRVIANAGQALVDLLQSAVNGAMVARTEIETAAATYLVYYRNHIRVEESEVLPRAAEAMTAEDWAAVAVTTAPGPDIHISGRPRNIPVRA